LLELIEDTIFEFSWMEGVIANLKRIRFLVFCTYLIFSLFQVELFASNPGKEILMQGFGWNSTNSGTPGKWYKLVGERANDLSDLGITMIWLPPVSRSVSPQGYLPGDYYDVGSRDAPTFYGDYDQLVNCLGKLKNAGIKGIADIVVNHRCAGEQDQNGIWNIFHFPSKKAMWENWAICRGEYGGCGNPD